jgi:hypothetical protein
MQIPKEKQAMRGVVMRGMRTIWASTITSTAYQPCVCSLT